MGRLLDKRSYDAVASTQGEITCRGGAAWDVTAAAACPRQPTKSPGAIGLSIGGVPLRDKGI